MKQSADKIKIGCCGFRRPQVEYTKFFSVVEVQHTFYHPPQLATLERWRQDAPADFEFTLKVWQLITHEARSPTYKRLRRELTERENEGAGFFKSTEIVKEAWETTLACAQALKAKQVLFQCPASFAATPENIANLGNFFSSVDRQGLGFAWEPRGAWGSELIRELCKTLDLWHLVDPFTTNTVTPDRCYFRLHGRRGWRYQYEDAELEELVTLVPKRKPSYVFFNNVRMIEDAARFQEMVRNR
jgi:uncharacterized protein YecE (DUF72 family)